MTLEEYEHMMEIYNYVYSAPPNTSEREKRFTEISKEDNEKLWDFYSGLCSGRIKKPENTNKEREVNTMTYGEWKILSKSNSGAKQRHVIDFERQNPMTAKDYKKRLEEEKKKRSEILAIQDTRARHKAIYENMALFGR